MFVLRKKKNYVIFKKPSYLELFPLSETCSVLIIYADEKHALT